MGIKSKKYRKKINLVAYPRSGMHFVRGTLESYGVEIFWGHDRFTGFKLSGVCYLYRNPVDVIYSWQATSHQIGEKSRKFKENYILRKARQLKTHRNFYFSNAGHVVKFEDLVKDIGLWKGVVEFFGKEYNEERIKEALADNTKEKIIEKFKNHYNNGQKYKWINSNMMTNEYEENRKLFYDLYAQKINNIIFGGR